MCCISTSTFSIIPLFRRLAHKTLTTLHGRQDLPDLADIYRAFPAHAAGFDFRSSAQAGAAGELAGHGLSRHAGKSAAAKARGEGGYLAFLGRICADKGILPAIEIARRAGLTLKVAAKVDPADREYFEEEVKPGAGAKPACGIHRRDQ